MPVRRYSSQRPLPNGRFFVLLTPLLLLYAACSGSDSGAPGTRSQELVGAPTAAEVVEGMTMEEVLSRWGRPSVKVREGQGERWHYWMRDDRQRVVSKTYVLFDDHKRVLEIIKRPEAKRDRDRAAPITISRAAGRGPGPGGSRPAAGTGRQRVNTNERSDA